MAKKIFATTEDIDEFLRSSQAQLLEETRKLKKKKFQNDQYQGVNFNFKMKEVKDDRKVTVKFSKEAWIKIYALVYAYSTEVEWHGVVERVSADTFFIKDVLIFPHKVTGATVMSDQAEYEKWLDSLDNDTFNALRFHGHSHVNMGVTPSSVDMDYRKNILNNFGTPTDSTDYFYIFFIFNKKGDISGEVYDLQNNALYSTDEINIVVEDCDWLTAFIKEAKSVVKENSYPATTANAYRGSSGYNGYGGYGGYGGYSGTPTPSTTDYYGNKHQVYPTTPKRDAKSEARQKSALDDNDPDPMDDGYYNGYYGYGYGRWK